MQHLLFEFIVRTALIAAGTAAVLRILRVRMAAARHSAWAGVVVFMLLLPVWMAWGPKASWRILPAATAPPVSHAVVSGLAFSELALPKVNGIPAPFQRTVLNWPAYLAGIYLLGVMVLLARLAAGTVRAQILVRRASRCEGRLTSDLCAAPITVGCLTPAVILPECWRRWPQAQLDAVLTHEGEHARRRDPLMQWLALMNRAVFWFHPLAWWLERRLSALAEEACDAAVLTRGCDPFEYSEYLMEMARRVRQTGARVTVLGMAMPGSFLPARIRQILEGRAAPRISRVRMACVTVACSLTWAVFMAGAVDRQRPASRADAPVVTVQNLPAPAPPATPLKPAQSAIIAQVQAAPTPTQEDKYKDKRMLVLYFDLEAMPALDRERAFAAAQDFVRTKIQSRDLVAIISANKDLKVMQDFTGDRDRLLQTLDQLMANSGPESGAAVDMDRQLIQLHTAVNMLGSLQGRKALVYFAAPGIQANSVEFQPLVDAAIRADVAFYSIDSRGLVNQPADAQQGQVDDALRRLQELAIRQQQLADQQKGQQTTADQRWQQEMLRREAVQLQQEVDRLNRSRQGQTPGADNSYVIGAEDVLQIWVGQQQGISGSYSIRPDGVISVPLVGSVRAAGLTTAQLEAVIADRLDANGIVSHAAVTVGVAAIHKRQ